MSNTAVVAIALGSNLGDRDAHLDFAVSRLSHLLSSLTVSSRYDTTPVDVAGDQPRYLNAALVGRTSLAPHALLHELQAIELADGRERPYVNAPRTLDIDLILYGQSLVDEEGLVVPHPRFRERTFVLEPLAEIAPDLVDPVTGATVQELLARLRRGPWRSRP